MSKNQDFNYLKWAKTRKEEDEKKTKDDQIEKALSIILLLATLILLFYIIFDLVSEVGNIKKNLDNDTGEIQLNQEPVQMEMNGWREPSAFDIIIHSDSGAQEPDTVGLSFYFFIFFIALLVFIKVFRRYCPV